MTVTFPQMANAIRFLSADGVQNAKSGHPGLPLGMADVMTVLFKDFLKFNPADPHWHDRDRFILSAGHGSMLLYSLLYLTGYKDATLEELKSFRQLGAKTAGHPEYGYLDGIETTTGPLGQGFATAVGMSLAEAKLRNDLGSDQVNHKTYVLASDGDLMEGISHEAASLAGHLNLNHLIVLFDDNEICIDGSTDLTVSDDATKRFESYGWTVISIDGHDEEAIHSALSSAQKADKPVLIRCHTTIAKGAPTKAGTSKSHGSPLGDDEIAQMRELLDWNYDPFHVPEDVLKSWRQCWTRNEGTYEKSVKNLASENKDRLNGDYGSLSKAFEGIRSTLLKDGKAGATRSLSGLVLEHLMADFPCLLAGSADLTPSNNTRTLHHTDFSKEALSGNYIHYGIREHAMAAMMNGIALHKGFIPYAGTFLVFSDYCKPSIRLSSLMKQQVVYVFTHDSIGLGEDGPTHQPVEHLSSLRSVPNLNVIRPASLNEVIDAWEIALTHKETPTVLALSRQNLPYLEPSSKSENLSAKGAYIIKDCTNPDVVLMGSGSEVSLCLDVAKTLANDGKSVRVISVPCQDLFDQQDKAYKESLMPKDVLKVAVEAAHSQSWYKYVGLDGIYCCVDDFGKSAPYDKIYEHFGLTTDVIVQKIKEHLS